MVSDSARLAIAVALAFVAGGSFGYLLAPSDPRPPEDKLARRGGIHSKVPTEAVFDASVRHADPAALAWLRSSPLVTDEQRSQYVKQAEQFR